MGHVPPTLKYLSDHCETGARESSLLRIWLSDISTQLWNIFFSLPRERYEVLWWVCLLSVCVPVCSHNSKTTRPNFHQIFVHVVYSRVRSFRGVAIRHVFPVSWMTSSFHIMALQSVLLIPIGGDKTLSRFQANFAQRWRQEVDLLIVSCALEQNLLSKIALFWFGFQLFTIV